MINIECTPENQDAVVKAVEQALKGVDANITVMDEEITELDVMQFMSYNIKQQRVYLGRIEGRAREMRGELRELKELLGPFFELSQIMLEQTKEARARQREEEKNGVSTGTGTFSTEEMSKMP